MIALFTSWVIIVFVFFTLGRAFLMLLKKITKSEGVYSYLDILMIGMCITASTIAIASLWMPANTMLLFALVFLCMLFWFCDYKNISTVVNALLDFVGKQPKWHLLLFAITTVAIAMFCTLHPLMTDTLYYHIQNIMWNEQYSVVPGLGNLQPRFAFNSSYFLLASTFGLKPAVGQYIFGVHTFFLTAIFVWIVYKVLHAKDIVRSVIAVIMILCFFVIYKIHITSVTTDFIPNLLILYLVIKVIFDRDSIAKSPALYFVLPIFIITLKLSCFSIILLPIYVLWQQVKNKDYSKSITLILTALFVVVPWCVRNVILSSYLIFPIPFIDLFDYDWKIPMEYVIEQKNFIQSFARYPNNIDIDAVLKMPISEWLPVWWSSDMQYYNPIANRFFAILTILTIPIGAILFFKDRKKDNKNDALWLLWFASLTGIIVWFFNAPDFRFIYSLILSQCFIVILLTLESLGVSEKIKTSYKHFPLQVVLTIITIIFVTLFSARWVYYQRAPSVTIMDIVKMPSSMEHSKIRKGVDFEGAFMTVEVNGMNINKRNGSERDVLCFDCDLPCSADYVGGIEMRGDNLQDGFRCRPDAPHRLTY